VAAVAPAPVGATVEILTLWLATGVFETAKPFGAALSVAFEPDADAGAGRTLHVHFIHAGVGVARVVGARLSVRGQVESVFRIANARARLTKLVVLSVAFTATAAAAVFSAFQVGALGHAFHDLFTNFDHVLPWRTDLPP